MEELEDAAILYISFAQSIQDSTDKRLEENFVSKAYLEDDLEHEAHDHHHSKWTDEFKRESDLKML